MDSFRQDVRYAFRQVRRQPGVASVTVATLALGIAAVTSAFSVVNAYLLRPLPFAEPDRLVHVWQSAPQQGSRELRVSVPNFEDWRAQATSFAGLAGYFYQDYTLTGDDEPARVQVGRVTPDLIDLLGTAPALGRAFRPEEGLPGRHHVVVLSHRFWSSRFAADPGVLGRSIELDGTPYAIVGVMPREFVFPLKDTMLWVPLPLDEWRERRELEGPLLVVGRLRPGVTVAAAQAEMTAIAERLARSYPDANAGRGASVVPLRRALLFFYDLLRVTLVTIFLAVALVLLMVCANVGNLLLAQAAGRSREVAVRTALGAGRARLIRQLLTESALLALAGGAAGALLARWTVGLLNPLLPEDLYRVGDLGVDAPALAFALLTSVATALLFGLAPALQTTKVEIVESLKEGDRGGGPVGSRLRAALVVAEVALATILLASSALMVRSFLNLQRVDLGFTPGNVLTMELILPPGSYPDAVARNRFYEEVLARVRGLPRVTSAAAVYPLPLNFESLSIEFRLDDRPPVAPGDRQFANSFWITTGYLEAMRIPLLRGRAFTDRDDDRAPPVVLVSRRMAQRFWPDADPVGRLLRLEPGSPEERVATIVGVVGDSKHFLLNEDTASLVYLPQRQDPTRRRFLVVRADGDPIDLVASVRSEIRAVDPRLPVTTIRTLQGVVEESLLPWRGGTLGLLGLCLGALVLAALGIAGVMLQAVGRRVREIGVRMALGARPADVARLVLAQGMTLAGAGVGLGLAAAVALTQLMRAMLFGVGRLDPLTFAGTPLLLALVAAAATYLPARRAARIDPIQALRHE